VSSGLVAALLVCPYTKSNSACTNSPKISNISSCVFVYVCLRLRLCGGELHIICIYACMTARLCHSTCHCAEIQISSTKDFYRVALRMKQVKDKWDLMFQLLGIRRKPLSRMWHVASWTDAKVWKESAALNSQFHSAGYSRTPVTTVYLSSTRRHTQEDVNVEEKFCKTQSSPSEDILAYRRNGSKCHIFMWRRWMLIAIFSVFLPCLETK
jgi:hypothetical protein